MFALLLQLMSKIKACKASKIKELEMYTKNDDVTHTHWKFIQNKYISYTKKDYKVNYKIPDNNENKYDADTHSKRQYDLIKELCKNLLLKKLLENKNDDNEVTPLSQKYPQGQKRLQEILDFVLNVIFHHTVGKNVLDLAPIKCSKDAECAYNYKCSNGHICVP